MFSVFWKRHPHVLRVLAPVLQWLGAVGALVYTLQEGGLDLKKEAAYALCNLCKVPRHDCVAWLWRTRTQTDC